MEKEEHFNHLVLFTEVMISLIFIRISPMADATAVFRQE